jgi:hypothetical protein
MTLRLGPTAFATRFPRVAGLMGEGNIAARIEELEWFGPEFVHQMECDLDFLGRRVGGPRVSAAYRDGLRMKSPTTMRGRLWRKPRTSSPASAVE